MEEDWEEEEQLVVAELSGVIDADAFCKSDGVCKIIGINSEQPIVQVGRYVFAGEYEDALGTCVIFEEDQTKPSSSPVLKYKCHTMKKLMLQRTFLSERREGETSSGGIEVLNLNDGDVCGRAYTVCRFGLDPGEIQRNAGEEDISDQSDTEKHHSSLKKNNEEGESSENLTR